MMTSSMRGGYVVLLSTVLLALHAPAAVGQAGQPPDQPVVTVRGQTYTPRSILARNMGTEDDQTTAFPPHKVVGNVYYVGTRTLSSYLITTSQGHILLNSTYERNVRTIEKSVTQLGFTFRDVRILLGTHAHGDHQEGDALVKELTGAQVMVMQEDVPALEAIKPGGKVHPIDRTLRDGEEVTLGGTTLVAHLTAGHTRGCTTWTMKAQEGGRSFNVVFACSYRAPGTVTPEIESEFNRTFKIVRSLPCDVPLGDHPAQYNLTAKYARLQTGAPNPFIDAANCWLEADIQEAMFRAQIKMQK
jgi:metallo-beta-lactamase class B